MRKIYVTYDELSEITGTESWDYATLQKQFSWIDDYRETDNGIMIFESANDAEIWDRQQ